MAGYRPKSLDELNSMYDKTLAAEKAIKKGTSLLESDDFSLPTEKEIDAIKQKEQELKSALETAYNAEVSPVSEESSPEEPFQKPEITHVTEPVFVPVESMEEAYREETETAEAEPTPEEQPPAESPVAETSHSSFRSDLMNDYMKIMSDEDDDDEEVPAEKKKLSRKEKKKLKRQSERAKAEAEAEEAAEETKDISIAEPEAEAEPLTEEMPEEYFETEENPIKSDDYEDIVSNTEDDLSLEVNDEFDFPENYQPEWMEEKEEEPVAETKARPALTVLKGILSVVVILAVALASFATTFKCIFSVNTGKAFADSYYAFTAKKDYEFANILEGDFIITEKVYAEDGDVFAYINYVDKTFEFAKRTKSITNDDEVIIVAENNDERVLVSRDDSRGVLYATYTGIGTYISFLSDYYIFVMVAAATVALGASLVIILSSKTKKDKKQSSEKDSRESSSDVFDEENIFADIN